MKTKIIAMHLPQFHEIKENNEWWGEGFTEWMHLKKKNKYPNGLEPLNDNYYNLLDKETMQWQCDLSKEYGVYGFCYYHYYFEGKLLLEKPVENLLKWKDVDQKFCFCWANHDWLRTWDGTRTLLQKQTYGDESAWQTHFNYLKDFFLDDRYIKIDNKPAFVLFKSFEISKQYFNFLNNKCMEIGFDGVYLIKSIMDSKEVVNIDEEASAIILREPTCAMAQYDRDMFVPFRKIRSLFVYRINKYLKLRSLLLKYKGNKIMKKSIDLAENITNNIDINKKPIYLGGFTMRDSSYRHFNRGQKISKPSKEIYIQYLKALKSISEKNGTEYIFFNAWNEWAEGMILEPDKENEYFFLEGIKEVFKDK